MPYASLREFLTRLEAAGRLVRVREPVSPVLEMTEIQTRLLAEGGPAVLFENVTGEGGRRYPMPVLVNLFGTVERDTHGGARLMMSSPQHEPIVEDGAAVHVGRVAPISRRRAGWAGRTCGASSRSWPSSSRPTFPTRCRPRCGIAWA